MKIQLSTKMSACEPNKSLFGAAFYVFSWPQEKN